MTKKNKLENVNLLYLIFWLKLFIHQNLKYKFSEVSIKTNSLFEAFEQNEIFFNVTLTINTFLSKSIKKTFTNHIRQLWIGKDWLISVKYWLNFTKVENWVNDINWYKQYKPILADILQSLNIYQLISVNIS